MRDLYAFHAVVGYFRSSGYFALQPHLREVKEIKILVGIDVDQMFAETQRKGLLFLGDHIEAKDKFLDWFIKDIKEAKYSEEIENGILQFIQDLVSGRIEVRAHNSKAIHAKFYLFLPQNHSAHSDGWVIMGSSNLTEAGLGIKRSPNYELNIALKDFDDVEFSKNEFAKLWTESTPILPADIEGFKKKTHIGQIFTPYELYIKFLIEYFGKNIDYDPDTVGDLPQTFKKLSYQIDAVNQGFQMLLDHNGFFLADVVGLGKTVVAAMIAQRFLRANGTLNTKILVVYPPALEKTWKETFRQFRIDKHAKFITNGSLEKILNGRDMNYWPNEEYDLVLVDEAHRYRNHTSRMFTNLQIICKTPRKIEGQITGRKKKVILISATPLNNRPQDLYYQLYLFQDARQSTIPGVRNLQTFFGPITREYSEIIRSEHPDLTRIRELYDEIREKVIIPITVRRTRKDLERYPKYKEDIKEQGIIFPSITKPRSKEYQLEDDLGRLFYQTMSVLTDSDHVGYFRYRAIAFLHASLRKEYYPQANLVSNTLARIMMTLMVKRLESSFFAFKRTLQNIANATERMIRMFEQNKVFIAPDLKVNDLMEKGWSLEDIEEFILNKTSDDPGSNNRIFSANDFEGEFLQGLKNDLRSLRNLVRQWETVKDDPKLAGFFDALYKDFLSKSINPTGKLVIFTESKDTADYLQDKIEKETHTKVINVSAKNRRRLFETIQENFDANYAGARKDDYKILITTDVLAEGVNLHRANVIINYDTPWNATRLMQRIGRVNRIGSEADKIYSYNFYPSPQGDKLIRLYNKALVKLQSFHSAFGEDAQIYTHEELVEQFELFKEGFEDQEDKRLQYLRVIREFKEKDPAGFKRIKQFPLKARTARDQKTAKKPDVDNSTVVFLKSTYKMEFYKINSNANANPLSFLEAAALFEAKASETPLSLPTWHYNQVQAALDSFERDFLGTATETVTTTDQADARTNQAKKFLREFRNFSQHERMPDICSSLIELLDRGTYTQLPNEIRKLAQKFEKKQLNVNNVESLIIGFSEKFDFLNGETTSQKTAELGPKFEPEIVLSETFI